ncbi:MAG: MATE family efflux transporter [Synergistaceae bacterium]|nr:MATE family efflux transporter [Synergistaceae bacterium]
MGRDSIPRLMIRFSLPAIGGMLANALYNIVDRIFVGRTVGPVGIGAISIVFPYMLLVISLGLLIGVGAGALVSISLGEKKKDRAEKTMGNALVLLCAGSIVIAAWGGFFSTFVLRISGAGPSMLPLAAEYLNVIVWGVPFSTLAFGLNFFIRAEGNPRYAMYTLFVGAFANILLDWLLIIGMGMGIRGAALATVASQILSLVWAAAFYIRRLGGLRFRLENLIPEGRIILRMTSIGLAPFLTEISFTFLMALFNRVLRNYGGDLAISAMGIFFSLDSLFFLPVLGLAEGVQPIIGYNYGARNYSRVISAARWAILLALSYFACSFLIILFFPEPMIRIFNDSDPELLALSVRALRIGYSGLVFASVSIIASQTFQAIGKPGKGIFLTLSRHFLFILAPLYFLPPIMGTDGVWIAMPLSDLGGCLIGSLFLKYEFAHMRRCMGTDEEIPLPECAPPRGI